MEAILKISEKLQKQMHIINSQLMRNNPKMLCDNLASSVMTVLEEIQMLPPADELEAVTGNIVYAHYVERVEEDSDYKPIYSKLWEPEEEE